MYLSDKTSFNIIFAINQLSKYNSDPKISHIKVTKRVVRYSKATMYLKFLYKAQVKDKKKTKALILPFLFELIRYGDSNYVKDRKDRK